MLRFISGLVIGIVLGNWNDRCCGRYGWETVISWSKGLRGRFEEVCNQLRMNIIGATFLSKSAERAALALYSPQYQRGVAVSPASPAAVTVFREEAVSVETGGGLTMRRKAFAGQSSRGRRFDTISR